MIAVEASWALETKSLVRSVITTVKNCRKYTRGITLLVGLTYLRD